MKYKAGIWAALISCTLTLTSLNIGKISAFAHSMDLNGMLETINHKTKQLGSLNQDIYLGLLSIDDKSSKTEAVSQKLTTASEGAEGQSNTLGSIRDVTGEQVILSQNLNFLSKQLEAEMRLISSSGQVQSDNSKRLKSITQDTLNKLRAALEENKRLEKKLKEAAAKSDRAARSLP